MSKRQKRKIENPKPTISKTNPPKEDKNICKELEITVNTLLEERKSSKVNSMNICGSSEKGCECPGEMNGNMVGQKTDLIVLIDTSFSVRDSAIAIDNAVSGAIEEAKKVCEPDLKITFLGVDGTWVSTHPTTKFDQSHRDYIFGIHGTVPLAADINHVGLRQEQGANAIEDLSKYNNWREGACRAIFYISDEELDSISPRSDFANETAATNAAIVEANANKVTVFTHHLTYQNLDPQIIQNYKDLCDKTGGQWYFSPAPDKDEYVRLLTEVICSSCGKKNCIDLEFPEIKPCISIKWGDSECDCMESSDYEILTLTVCNCYSNFKFSDFKVSMIEVLDENGNPVPTLPNGTPSVKIHPIGVYCFGDIAPCSCVTREFVLINEGAKEGKYKIVLKGICFDVTKTYSEEEVCFEFKMCKD